MLLDVPDERRGTVCCALLPLFLLQLALRIEVADTAALAASRRVEHCVDEGRLTGVHSRIDGPLELVRGRRVNADAAEFVATSAKRYDIVLVDIYDANGFSLPGSGFWRDCVARLTPTGVMAVNWADFVGHDIARAQSSEIAAAARYSLFMTPRGLRDNLVQFASNRRLPEAEELAESLPGASRMQRPRSTLGRFPATQRAAGTT